MAEATRPGAHDTLHGLPAELLLAGEQVLRRWTAPGGLGLLTNLRCLLLGHPHPIHRSVRWAVLLNQIQTVSVEFVPGLEFQGLMVRPGTRTWSGGGGAKTTQEVGIPPGFQLLVDGTVLFEGSWDRCTEIERRIEEARGSRSR